MKTVERVAVIGAGTMGQGIAEVAARAGFRTALYDAAEAARARALDAIRASLARAVERGKLSEGERDGTLERLDMAASLDDAARDADLVVEAVPEDLDLKRRVFAQLETAAGAEAVLATNTSSLPVSGIAEATRRPERVVGMHFFNPVPVMELLEIVRGSQTSDATVAAVLAAGRRLGKECIVVRDAPGFATSRLGVLLGLEAIRMVEDGVADAESIDKAMTLGYRHPVGPLRLTDLVGLDVRLAIAEHLHQALASPAFAPPQLLRTMVAQGRLGKKSGQGFYTWA